MRRVPARRRVGFGVAAVALLVLALPLLGAALVLGPGGLPHEAAFHADASHDVSAAALDHLDRWLHGGLVVALDPLTLAAAPAAVRATVAPEAASAPTGAGVRAAESERRL